MCGASKNMIAGLNFNNNVGFNPKTLMDLGQRYLGGQAGHRRDWQLRCGEILCRRQRIKREASASISK